MKFNRFKAGLTLISIVLFSAFFLIGYNVGKKQAETNFPEPEEIWAKEEGVRIDDGISPEVVRLEDGTWRMYYVVKDGIVSAVSQNGLLWNKEDGVRVTPDYHSNEQARIGSPTVIQLKEGGFRMFFEGSNGKQTIFAVFSAASKDGIEWKVEKGTRIKDKNRFGQDIAAAPDVVKIKNGDLYMYYCDGDTIKLTTSDDEGLTWQVRSITGLPKASLDPSVIVMPDGVFRIYFALSESPERLTKVRILSARSSNGFDWSVESGIRVAADKDANMVLDPDINMVSMGRMRLYYTQLDKGVMEGKGSNAPVMSIRSATLELR